MQEQPFLKLVANYLHQHFNTDLDKLCLVLPSKRGALYLKQHLAKVYNKTIWLPTIISTEELIGTITNLKSLDTTDLLCELYEAYKAVYEDEAETFESFIKWGNLILHDFNEIDRYLVDADAIYTNLKNIKEIENWSLGEETLSDYQQNYCDFMQRLGDIYHEFQNRLLSKSFAYQGLIYREAAQGVASHPIKEQYQQILFCGFNALNKAEIAIFSSLVKDKKATILWDADRYYLENDVQEAGLFLRRNFKNTFLKNNTFIIDAFRQTEKQIDVIGVPKGVGEAQVVKTCIEQLLANGESLDRIAIVLADETLLFPVLSQLPSSVEHVNITMEYPLRHTPLYDLMEQLLVLHASLFKKDKISTSFYYIDVLRILYNPFFVKYYQINGDEKQLRKAISRIQDKNYVWLNTSLLQDIFQDDFSFLAPLFTPWKDALKATEAIQDVISVFHNIDVSTNVLEAVEIEYIHAFTKQFNRLKELVHQFSYLQSIKALHVLFKQIVSEASVAFIGEPLRGLQIMGVLETRTLDFNSVIMVGVNENVLPSGKSSNSFIPNDLKRYFNMPLYADKDAIYAYHFYRLLQRASNVSLIYNTEADVFGNGEKSRFITQLVYELPLYNPRVTITESIATVVNTTVTTNERLQIAIPKTTESLELVVKKAIDTSAYGGLSPSSLIAYKDCSLRFYYRYAVGIKETVEVEEIAEANTFGTILHESLESLYKPAVGRVLTEQDVTHALQEKKETIARVFENYFSQKEAHFGKNYLQQSVLNIYVEKLITQDLNTIRELKKVNNYVSIIDLEKELSTHISIPINGEILTVIVKGKIDRIDRLGAVVRIIDYKTSIAAKDKFEFENFDELFSQPEYNKLFQLFMYGWLAVKNNICEPEALMPCIIPFKKFQKEPSVIKQNKQPLVFSKQLLDEFEAHLIQFVTQMFNTNTSFTSTEDEERCTFCAYADICNVNI